MAQIWQKIAEYLDWMEPWSKLQDTSFAQDSVHIRWYEGGKLNVSANCVDRHAAKTPERVAIIWEGDDPTQDKRITYRELSVQVCKTANALKSLGVKKGDRVIIYMPMIPEAAFAMLACTRIGAIHSVVFGGFSPEALAGRIDDCRAECVITADEGVRGGKSVPLKANVDEALAKLSTKVKSVIVAKRTGGTVAWNEGRDIWWHDVVEKQPAECPPIAMDSEDPLFILYTSGSTGKPKGVLHTTAGYLAYIAHTHRIVFDYMPRDVYWCTADIGWITGHSYLLYGPLANGATTLMFEGVPNYPDYSRFWNVIDKHKVNIFYTAPTAIRALMAQGDEWVKKTSRKTLRVLGSVGEPINPEAWRWYHEVVGEERCPVVDTWWQTETGGILISAQAAKPELVPGSATKPLPGIEPAILDPQTGKELTGEAEGVLCLKSSWPGQMRTVFGDHARFVETYFSQYKGYYFSGDGARRDKEGNYWITGRVDDVLNVSGHRIGTAEVESALVAHPKIAEAAVVGYPHPIKGQGIYVFVTPMTGIAANDNLLNELKQWVRKEIGPIATPDIIQWAQTGLPKTRSGKIMRRILRKIAENEFSNLGDTNTLTNPDVVEQLIAARKLIK